MPATLSADWLILYATPGEAAGLLKHLGPQKARSVAGLKCSVGRLPVGRRGAPGRRVVCVETGIGQANAAFAAGVALAAFRIHRVLSLGVAGGYSSDAWHIGDVACGCAFGLGDEGVVSSSGWLDLGAIGIPLLPLPRSSRKPASCNAIPDRLVPPPPGLKAPTGGSGPVRPAGILTVAACSGSPSRAREMRRRAGRLAPYAALPWVEDMETSAIALACARAGKPLLALRGISNICGNRDKAGWDLAGAARAVQGAAWQALTENPWPGSADARKAQ